MSGFRSDLLAGQAGIVTGGSSGIGLAIARQLLAHGAKVTITGRDQDKLDGAVADLGEGAFGVTGDVRKADAVKGNCDAHLERFERIDFLINNAAGNFICPLEQMSENAFRAVNDIITLGTFLWCKAVFPLMKQQKAGRIVNTGTTYAFGHGAAVAHSGAAKAAVLNLTKSMAVEWGPLGILSNMIAPGPVEGTEGVRRLLGEGDIPEPMRRLMPVPRMAQGEEVGNLVVFLVSSMGAYLNGTVIPIDGGLHLVNPGLLPPGMM